MFIFVCVCKNPKFECLTDTPVFLPTSSPPGSGSVVSGPPVPVLRMTLSSGSPAPVLGTSPSSGPPVPVLCTTPLGGNPPGAVPDTSGPNFPISEYLTAFLFIYICV